MYKFKRSIEADRFLVCLYNSFLHAKHFKNFTIKEKLLSRRKKSSSRFCESQGADASHIDRLITLRQKNWLTNRYV